MQIQSLGSQKANIKFSSDADIEKAVALVSADDSELQTLAYLAAADKENQKRHHNSLINSFYFLPVVDTIASGILPHRYSTLSDRVKASGSNAASWGLIIAALGAFDAAKKIFSSSSPGVKKFENDNPVASFFVDIVAIIGGLAIGGALFKRFMPDKIKDLGDRFIAKVDKLDETKLNKKVLPKVTEKVTNFIDRFPKIAGTGKFVLRNLVLIYFGVSLLKMFNRSSHEQKQIENNYNELKMQQAEAAQYLANKLGVDPNTLFQPQENDE